MDFELPDLTGRPTVLSDRRGSRVLLIFLSPHCAFSRQMLPDLAALIGNGNGSAAPVVITIGSAEENRALMDEHGVQFPMLVQDETQVLDLYLAPGTPTAYLIDEDGTLASGLAVGAEEILLLAASGSLDGNGTARRGAGRVSMTPRGGADHTR